MTSKDKESFSISVQMYNFTLSVLVTVTSSEVSPAGTQTRVQDIEILGGWHSIHTTGKKNKQIFNQNTVGFLKQKILLVLPYDILNIKCPKWYKEKDFSLKTHNQPLLNLSHSCIQKLLTYNGIKCSFLTTIASSLPVNNCIYFYDE